MFAEFRHLDGAQAGEVRAVRRDFATIGRHPSADIRFDSERVLDVSGRHAAVFRQGDRWMVRDLGSSKGTWVNGTRIRADQALADRDVLQLGPGGPRLEFHAREGEPGMMPGTRAEPTPAGEGAVAPPRPPVPRVARPPRAAARIRPQVHRRTAPNRVAAIAVLVLLAGALAVMGWRNLERRRAVESARTALLARSDTLLARLETASSGVATIRGELDRSRRELAALHASIAAGTSRRALDSLGERLAVRAAAGDGLVRAAALDPATVARAESTAVAVVLSGFPGSGRVLGSGFAIRVTGDTAWLVTCRHLVADSLGTAVPGLGVIFDGGTRRFPAALLAVADSADLALLAIRIRGGMPAFRGPGSDPAQGDPVVVTGFPPGLALPAGGDWQAAGVRAGRFVATVLGERGGGLELEGYGSHGAGGSPVLNGAGEVVGVLSSGDPGPEGRPLSAIPGRAVAALLRRPHGTAPPVR